MSTTQPHHRSPGFESYISRNPNKAVKAMVRDIGAQAHLGNDYRDYKQGCYPVIEARTNDQRENSQVYNAVYCPICIELVNGHDEDALCADHILAFHPNAIFGAIPHPITVIPGSLLNEWGTSTHPDDFAGMAMASRRKYLKKSRQELLDLMAALGCQHIDEIATVDADIDVSALMRFLARKKKLVVGDDGLASDKAFHGTVVEQYICVLRETIEEIMIFLGTS